MAHSSSQRNVIISASLSQAEGCGFNPRPRQTRSQEGRIRNRGPDSFDEKGQKRKATKKWLIGIVISAFVTAVVQELIRQHRYGV